MEMETSSCNENVGSRETCKSVDENLKLELCSTPESNMDIVHQLQCQLNQSKQKLSEQSAQLKLAQKKISEQQVQLIETAKLMVEQEKHVSSVKEKRRISNEMKTKLLETTIAKLEKERQLRIVAGINYEKLKTLFKSINLDITNVIGALRDFDGICGDMFISLSSQRVQEQPQNSKVVLFQHLFQLDKLVQNQKVMRQFLKENNEKIERMAVFAEKIVTLKNVQPSLTSSRSPLPELNKSNSFSQVEMAGKILTGQFDSSSTPPKSALRRSSRIETRSGIEKRRRDLRKASSEVVTEINHKSSEEKLQISGTAKEYNLFPLETSKEFVSGSHEVDPTGQRCTCGYKVNSWNDFRRHIVRSTTQPKFQCGQCDKRFVYCWELKHHYKSVHKILWAFSNGCRHCGKCFWDRSALVVHQKTDHGTRDSSKLEDNHKQNSLQNGNIKNNENNEVARVNPSNKISTQKTTKFLKRHRRDRSTPTHQYHCVCGSKFNDAVSLARHINIKRKNSTFKCKLCSKAFKTRTKMKHHVLRHHKRNHKKMNGLYRCATCSRTFLTKDLLRIHKKRTLRIERSKRKEAFA